MKVAISLPEPIFEAAEALARDLRLSRSRLYATALAEFVESRSDHAITAKLNEVYARTSSGLDPLVAAMQAKLLADEAW